MYHKEPFLQKLVRTFMTSRFTICIKPPTLSFLESKVVNLEQSSLLFEADMYPVQRGCSLPEDSSLFSCDWIITSSYFGTLCKGSSGQGLIAPSGKMEAWYRCARMKGAPVIPSCHTSSSLREDLKAVLWVYEWIAAPCVGVLVVHGNSECVSESQLETWRRAECGTELSRTV